LGVDFDKIYYESQTYLEGKEKVLEGLEKGIMYRKEDGSVWADLTAEGLDHKLLLRSDGTSVYMTQDIGTAKLRFKDFPIDKMIYVVGNEQNYHFQVLSILLDKLGFKWGNELLEHIKSKDTSVLTTLIHKFESAGKKRTDFVDTDDNIYVLIDEAHRSQGGDANMEMLRVIPNACVIAFTGTPLLRKDKSRSKFGEFIDKYTIDDALADHVVLPLIYEGRYVALDQNAPQIDRLADRVSEDLSAQNKYKLQRRVENRTLAEVPSKLEEVCADIEDHYMHNFKNTGLKGQIVAPSKYAAVVMQRWFERRHKLQTALIISDDNNEISEEDLKKQEVADYLSEIKAKYAGKSRCGQRKPATTIWAIRIGLARIRFSISVSGKIARPASNTNGRKA
jgi:hypothetical protein